MPIYKCNKYPEKDFDMNLTEQQVGQRKPQKQCECDKIFHIHLNSLCLGSNVLSLLKNNMHILPPNLMENSQHFDVVHHLLPLSSFILPGGAAPSAYLHQARTVCRRAERICVALESEHTLNKNALIYLNRLSDFLFIAARWCNNQGQTDVLWVPGGNSN